MTKSFITIAEVSCVLTHSSFQNSACRWIFTVRTGENKSGYNLCAPNFPFYHTERSYGMARDWMTCARSLWSARWNNRSSVLMRAWIKNPGVLIQKATSGGVSQRKTNCHLSTSESRMCVFWCTGARETLPGDFARRLWIRLLITYEHTRLRECVFMARH